MAYKWPRIATRANRANEVSSVVKFLNNLYLYLLMHRKVLPLHYGLRLHSTRSHHTTESNHRDVLRSQVNSVKKDDCQVKHEWDRNTKYPLSI